MSQATRIRTQIIDRGILVTTLKGLGHAVEEGHLEVRGFGGKRIRVEVKIPSDNPAYDIGFARVGSALAPMADWKGLAKVDPDKLHRRVLRCYCYHAARDLLARQGYAVVSEELDDEMCIHLVLARPQADAASAPPVQPGPLDADPPPPPTVRVEACIEQDGHVRLVMVGLADSERADVLEGLLEVLGGEIEPTSPPKPIRPNPRGMMAG